MFPQQTTLKQHLLGINWGWRSKTKINRTRQHNTRISEDVRGLSICALARMPVLDYSNLMCGTTTITALLSKCSKIMQKQSGVGTRSGRCQAAEVSQSRR